MPVKVCLAMKPFPLSQDIRDANRLCLISKHLSDPELVPGADWLISIEVDLDHFFAADAVVELVFQSQEYLPRFDIDHLAAGRISVFAVNTK
jgi:hypothetical protein